MTAHEDVQEILTRISDLREFTKEAELRAKVEGEGGGFNYELIVFMGIGRAAKELHEEALIRARNVRVPADAVIEIGE